MSEVNDLLVDLEMDEELKRLENEKYFEEQDKKFDELHKKLVLLKDENKRHMDIIINSIDELIANKNMIEKTLENIDDTSDFQVPDDKNLTVVELLSKVTGFISETEAVRTTLSSECLEDDPTGDNATDNLKEDDVEIITDSPQEVCKIDEVQGLVESTKLLSDLCINSIDAQKPDD